MISSLGQPSLKQASIAVKEKVAHNSKSEIMHNIITSCQLRLMLFLFLHFLGCESLEALLAENSQYVAKLSQLVLHETDREKSRVYANLILTQGYIKGVIKEMIEEGSFLLQKKLKSTYSLHFGKMA